MTEIVSLNSYRSMLLRVSSEDKGSGSTNNSSFQIALQNENYRIDNIAGVYIKYIACPNVFPNVPSYANVLQLTKTTGAVVYTINVPVGQYSVSAFVTALQSAINTAIGPDSVVVSLTATNFLNFVFTGDTYSFSFNNSTIKNIIGLTADIGPLANITMQSIPNLTGETEVYIHSRKIASANLSEPSGSFSVVDVLPLNVPYGSTAYSNFNDDEFHFIRYTPYETKRSYRTIDITLRNRTGQILVLPDNFFFNMILKVFYFT